MIFFTILCCLKDRNINQITASVSKDQDFAIENFRREVQKLLNAHKNSIVEAANNVTFSFQHNRVICHNPTIFVDQKDNPIEGKYGIKLVFFYKAYQTIKILKNNEINGVQQGLINGLKPLRNII